jgi:hypothetical protein
MKMKDKDLGGRRRSLTETNNAKSSSRRPASEEEQVTKRKEASDMKGDAREKAFAQWDNDDTGVAQSARIRGILAMVRSTRGNKRADLVNTDFNIASYMR